MAPLTHPRRENPVTANKYLRVGLLAGAVCFVILLLLCLLRFHRSRMNKKRIAKRSAPPFRVMMAETDPLSISIPPFSRQELTASIAVPQHSVTRSPSPRSTSDKTASRLESSATSPTLSLLRPLSNISFGASRSRTMSIFNTALSRHSRASSGFSAYSQYPSSPGSNSRPSSTISVSPMQPKPVRQLFEASLPDELSVVRYGECLTVLRSFDDGWCLVVRDTPRSSRISHFPAWMASTSNGDNVDLGLVPAWVFVRPLKGITVTRPFRGSSVSALEPGQSPSPSFTRGPTSSWSSFT